MNIQFFYHEFQRWVLWLNHGLIISIIWVNYKKQREKPNKKDQHFFIISKKEHKKLHTFKIIWDIRGGWDKFWNLESLKKYQTNYSFVNLYCDRNISQKYRVILNILLLKQTIIFAFSCFLVTKFALLPTTSPNQNFTCHTAVFHTWAIVELHLSSVCPQFNKMSHPQLTFVKFLLCECLK